MSALMVISLEKIVVARGLTVDIFDSENHTYLEVPDASSDDRIFDILLSTDAQYLAVLVNKNVLVYDLTHKTPPHIIHLQRAAMKMIFIESNSSILVADKTGDVLKYKVNAENDKGIKLLSHISLLLDILMTEDEKFIITCDRDEKIRVSCYPNTYNIQAYCLGHKEFVRHLQLLPHNKSLLVSCSGDGTVKLWNYIKGDLCLNIVISENYGDEYNNYVEAMNKMGINASSLPIMHISSEKVSENQSIVGVILFNLKKVLIYSINEVDNNFNYSFEQEINLEHSPIQIQFQKSFLYILDRNNVLVYQTTNNKINFTYKNTIEMFKDKQIVINSNENEDIIMLYKRKFDNVEEYMERKKKRLENKK